jgi:hypothetical protein
MFATGSVGLSQFVLPDAGARVAAELRSIPEIASTGSRPVWIGEPAVAARARIYLRGEVPLTHAIQTDCEAVEEANIALQRGDRWGKLGPEWLIVGSFTHGYDVEPGDVFRAALDGSLQPFLDAHQQQITVAVRHDSRAATNLHMAQRTVVVPDRRSPAPLHRDRNRRPRSAAAGASAGDWQPPSASGSSASATYWTARDEAPEHHVE